MSDPTVDPVVRDLRSEISEIDRAIVAAVNARLELVARLRRYKESQGLPFLDPERERQLAEELARANPGPLSDQGLRDLVATLLELTKREVTRDGEADR
jgi:chorismate mutase/prephenate dehydratase